MTMRTPSEQVTPFRDARGDGAIVFDPSALPQTPVPGWFDAAHWGDAAHVVGSGGRGAAWFIDAPWGAMVLRRYLRGGLIARFSHDRYVWRGEAPVRSFAEFRLLQTLHAMGLPVPRPLAAAYWRDGRRYRAAILLERIIDVQSFGHRALDDAASAPWAESGALIARFHRAGLDHPDLNAHNLLFDDDGNGWMIDFDKARLRDPVESGWRRANLARLHRSLHKLGGPALAGLIDAGFATLRSAYDAGMSQEATR
ncbi:MAG: 3-deoxy-D-manno-octulosonic acid kinase [Xanthomonadaceae bacterium]|nr:3-deoxy-D-manno-octulosonic acid kinase [Xanthomonadaceae bacterium]